VSQSRSPNQAWVPSPELRTRIKEAASDLTTARDTPHGQFPGHKEIYCANLEGWLGGYTVALLGALERVEAERDALLLSPENESKS
jgi:hypothetical protein